MRRGVIACPCVLITFLHQLNSTKGSQIKTSPRFSVEDPLASSPQGLRLKISTKPLWARSPLLKILKCLVRAPNRNTIQEEWYQQQSRSRTNYLQSLLFNFYRKNMWVTWKAMSLIWFLILIRMIRCWNKGLAVGISFMRRFQRL